MQALVSYTFEPQISLVFQGSPDPKGPKGTVLMSMISIGQKV